MRNYFFLLLFLHLNAVLFSQVQLRLDKNETLSSCYDITVVNVNDVQVVLAGQNYRLYYDASSALFQSKSLVSYLPSPYSPLKVVQEAVGDATGYGNLSFEKNLGFINLATDLHLTGNSEAIILEKFGEFQVASLCFDNESEIAFYWAKEGATDGYATAFNEIAQLHTNGLLAPVVISEYILPSQNEFVPMAFNLGIEGNALSNKNEAISVSEKSRYTTDNKEYNLKVNPTKGKYVVMTSKQAKHSDLIQLLGPVEELSDDNSTVLVQYFETYREAGRAHRKFLNIGFEDATLRKIALNGQLELVKKQ